ncbi:hypothetical protein C6558_07670 [Ensifer sp. NM-2]|nr:hypothetical protein C6558_07670 [Ensifer sp. NM-2]
MGWLDPYDRHRDEASRCALGPPYARQRQQSHRHRFSAHCTLVGQSFLLVIRRDPQTMNAPRTYLLDIFFTA